MRKFYRIIVLLITLIFLTTYTPNQYNYKIIENNSFFKIKNISIKNNFLIDTNKIENRLKNIYKKNILFIKKGDIENPLKSLNFFKKIDIKKKYPNTILIKIYETTPVANTFKKNIKYIIDSDSNLIMVKENLKFEDLPNVFGDFEERKFIKFFDDLIINNFPINKVENYYYFKIGRWDLQLLTKQVIKFPYDDLDDAIKRSIQLLYREDFKNFNVIDLRIKDKVIVE